ncbi:cytochrome P450 [Polychaeton citri CBS 116435]|uniref:Cytochrome P450 n=1 Tax=Polychaeton citri CBS 116435 TaxID=1314669 RepID=A0A9P4UKU3_9PEZI|nr:cytochrome P450 [Polychaeton citri CBS 116435]
MTTLGLAAGALLVVGYWLYRAMIPKPIPGIPYHKPSGSRMFGDVPDAMAWNMRTREMVSFLQFRCTELNTPICQVFVRPFKNPWVVICDAQESVDIMARRVREFDRSDFFGDLFTAHIPHNQVGMKTTDEWRAHRRLMADTMAPDFLNNVAAEQLYIGTHDILELWTEKMRLAAGRPFDAEQDIYQGLLDAIWATAFGQTIGTTRAQIDLLSNVNKVEGSEDIDSAAIFPKAKNPAAFDALITLTHSSEIPMNSPLPRLHYRFALKFYPKLSKAFKLKDALIAENTEAAAKRLTQQEKPSDDHIKCAVDLMVHRESKMAEKEGRAPQYHSPSISDELYGFVIAGHETSSTTICWGLKYLTTNTEAQRKLRAALRKAFPRAADAGIEPSAKELAKAHIPYLDAFIEETLRMGCTTPANSRTSTVDTEILGYHIPKGTDIFMLTTGPSYRMAPFKIENSRRSTSSVMSEDKIGNWDKQDIGEFKPERWLVTRENGEVEFNLRAGPINTFGGGLRGCFGKKLAYVTLRLVFALIVWKFELEPTPPELSTYAGRDVLTHAPQQVYLRLAEPKA